MEDHSLECNNVETDDGGPLVFNIKASEENIRIRYCPFCGEEIDLEEENPFIERGVD